MLRTRFLRWRVVGQTCLIVLGIIAVKLGISAFSLEFISNKPAVHQRPGGGVFVLGLNRGRDPDRRQGSGARAVFISLMRLLHIMDRPFHLEERTDDDLSLFLPAGSSTD